MRRRATTYIDVLGRDPAVTLTAAVAAEGVDHRAARAGIVERRPWHRRIDRRRVVTTDRATAPEAVHGVAECRDQLGADRAPVPARVDAIPRVVLVEEL